MKVAFVVQRYGDKVNGGAEFLCRRLAERLARMWDIDVLTTCAYDYMTWKDEYPAGVTVENGVQVHRFPVSMQRSPWFFSRCYDFVAMTEQAKVRGRWWRRLHGIYRRSGCRWLVERLWMFLQGPYSKPLQSYIQSHQDDYDVFVFFTYCYATTWYSLPHVKDKAVLLPMAHDDVAYRLAVYDPTFHMTKNFVFLTPEEQNLVAQRENLHEKHAMIASLGTDIPEDVDSVRFRKTTGIQEDFILYVGRVEEQKGCPDMVHHFVEYKKQHPGDLKLVVIGKEFWKLPQHPDIIPLGFVDEQCKTDAMAAAEVLVMPSPYESLSIVLLEAWSVKTPCLVTRACHVLVGQCERSAGGLVYDSTESFIQHLYKLRQNPSLREDLGEKGLSYVLEHYTWQKIESQWQLFARQVADDVGTVKQGDVVTVV